MMVQGPSTFRDAWLAALNAWERDRGTERLWRRDTTLWTGSDEASRLGWLDAAAADVATLDELEHRAQNAAGSETSDVLLIGIGGSSLAAHVIANTMPAGVRRRALRILDSTHPASVRSALSQTRWDRTLTIVASKSGTTLEPNLLFGAAWQSATAALGAARAAKRFIAITDPNTALEQRATELGFADVIHGQQDIGGRYSALSAFGLIPAALVGLRLRDFTESARAMADACRGEASQNPGVQLGVFMGVAARAGRDKCTLVLPKALHSLGGWIEQLVAESTGKHSGGILPIHGEPLRSGESYGDDRAFVSVGDGADALVPASIPTFSIAAPAEHSLAGEFFRWEFATAVAASLLGVNPFNQPDVESAKAAARALTDACERGERLPAPNAPPLTALRSPLSSAQPPAYVALLAYLDATPETEQALQRVRMRIRDVRRVATMVGFGPQYLHSTGQAFKGGPPNGVFIVVTHEAATDLPVPGRALSFGTVLAAQAAGDQEVLRKLGRTVVRIHLRGELRAALTDFENAVAAALA